MLKSIQRSPKNKKTTKTEPVDDTILRSTLKPTAQGRTVSEYTLAEPLPSSTETDKQTTLEPTETVLTNTLIKENPHTPGSSQHTRKRHWIRWTIFFIILGLIVGGAVYAFSFYSIIRDSITDKDGQHSTLQQIVRIIDKNVEKIKGEESDRINILLLGMGGENYPGGTLTDTVMIASIQPSTDRVTLISIPRDLVVPIPPENLETAEYLKINSVLVHGEMDMEYKIIKLLTGLDIHYHILADFDGFVDVIDAIDGIDVDVETAFQGYYGTDQLNEPCPISDRRTLDDGPYCLESFAEGKQQMDGYTALMYSRIRKVPSTSQHEGGDYARAARQQKVIQAFKEKTLNIGTLFNPVTVGNLLTAVGKHVSTNMEIWEMLRIAEIAKEVSQENTFNIVLNTDINTGVLVEERSETTGAFYQRPKAGLTTYTEIHALIEKTFNPEIVKNNHTNKSNSALTKTPRIVIQNASGKSGLAATASTFINTHGFTDVVIGNALSYDQTTTHIYDLTNGAHTEAIAQLESLFEITAQKASLPSRSSVRLITDIDPRVVDVSQLDETTDIVILLGQDQRDLSQ